MSQGCAEVGRPEAVLRRSRLTRRTGRATCSSGAPISWVRPARPRIFPEASARHQTRRDGQGSRRGRQEAWRSSGTTRRRKEKLDLLVTLDYRMSTTCMYSDIVLPTTDLVREERSQHLRHAPVHPSLVGGNRSGLESRSGWDIYKGIAEAFSKVSPEVLGVEKDVVLTPIIHDSPGEIAPSTLKLKKGGSEPIPGKTMPAVTAWSSATIRTSTNASPRSGR